jgi:hypothetical protein
MLGSSRGWGAINVELSLKGGDAMSCPQSMSQCRDRPTKNETIATALIAAAATILGSSIPVIYSWYKDRETLAPVSSAGQKGGCWQMQGPSRGSQTLQAGPLKPDEHS